VSVDMKNKKKMHCMRHQHSLRLTCIIHKHMAGQERKSVMKMWNREQNSIFAKSTIRRILNDAVSVSQVV